MIFAVFVPPKDRQTQTMECTKCVDTGHTYAMYVMRP